MYGEDDRLLPLKYVEKEPVAVPAVAAMSVMRASRKPSRSKTFCAARTRGGLRGEPARRLGPGRRRARGAGGGPARRRGPGHALMTPDGTPPGRRCASRSAGPAHPRYRPPMEAAALAGPCVTTRSGTGAAASCSNSRATVARLGSGSRAVAISVTTPHAAM